MDFTKILESLKIDIWYKYLLYMGSIVFILSLTIDTKGLPNILIQLVSCGILMIGLGEWKNHKVIHYDKIIPETCSTPCLHVPTSEIVRNWTILGTMLDFIGVILILVGLF